MALLRTNTGTNGGLGGQVFGGSNANGGDGGLLFINGDNGGIALNGDVANGESGTDSGKDGSNGGLALGEGSEANGGGISALGGP